jgi:nitrate/TMAO reductase-like tetraheme cytochrome c subunit
MPESTEEHKRLHRRRLLFLLFGGAIAMVLLVIGAYDLLEFMDSSEFCGRLCHVEMYPEWTTHQESPHSRVTCAEGHVGSGASYLVQSKISGAPLIWATVFHTYDPPIETPVTNLRPARYTCEQCHRPERFAGALVRYYTTYLEDENNTPNEKTVGFKVGGGQPEIAGGIHWHIGAQLWYLPLDDEREEITWVGVIDSSGNQDTFVDPDKAEQITSELIEAEKRLMDCIDCHNRATHIYESPEDLIDKALLQGSIDSGLPYVKREGLKALDPVNPSLEQATEKVEAIADFYSEQYPQIYAEKAEEIDEAIEELKQIAVLTTFPTMKITWETYPNFASHEGCSRCHGTLAAETGDNEGQLIDNSCNLCHDFF